MAKKTIKDYLNTLDTFYLGLASYHPVPKCSGSKSTPTDREYQKISLEDKARIAQYTTRKGVVTASDANRLAENGGPMLITKNWAKRLLGRVGLVKHQATTKVKVTPSN